MMEDILRIIANLISLTISVSLDYCLQFGQNKSSSEAKKENSWALCDYVVFFSIKHLCI